MSQQSTSFRWPTPAEGQSRITLLGSHHLANQANDEHVVEADDTLASQRQAELTTLSERLQERELDHVAVEVPRSEQAALDGQYEAIRDGLAFDADDEVFPDGPIELRSEGVQIGFRLAAALGHDRVHAVDSRPEFPDIDADWSIDVDADSVPYAVPDYEKLVASEERTIRNSTLVEVLRNLNQPSRLRLLQSGNVAASFSSSDADGDGYVGSRQIGYWYERNGRITENLRRVTGPEEETLFVVGASHVVPVKQLLDAEPSTCPRSSLPLLSP